LTRGAYNTIHELPLVQRGRWRSENEKRSSN